ncbi:hypothetical protein [Gloeobacter morelensis]|uniref:Nif11 domain-containing protein n=1 Tax=Gloeobacter morelensis MG652769 TaxID=2781736 RepID=A0ABY3PMV9_9CYAN|nr:hypothetical protein [Gloeobacter morelensis]UFP94986.1 hypothetical protein ISF26_01685 [Gloeobacter morelensis MG652769]
MQGFVLSQQTEQQRGRVELDLEFKSFFIELVERSHAQGLPLERIIDDIRTACCDLGVPGLDELTMVQWAKEVVATLERPACEAAPGRAALVVCHLCGKINPAFETNCASFCPHSA